MRQKKSSLFFSFVVLSINLLNCNLDSHPKSSLVVEEGKINSDYLKIQEWQTFIDSIQTFPVFGEESSDSISLFFMKIDAPSVLASPKYIFWKGGRIFKQGEFGYFITINKNHFLLLNNRKRSLSVKEIFLSPNELKEFDKVLLDLNLDNSLQDPCNQISNTYYEINKQSILFKFEIYQSCTDKLSLYSLVYPLQIDEKIKSNFKSE